MLDRKGFLADAREGITASTIQFARWADVGAESLVKAQLSGDGATLRGELRLFSVAAGREELKVSADAERFSYFMLYEMFLPSLLQKKLVRFLAACDRRWLNGRIEKAGSVNEWKVELKKGT